MAEVGRNEESFDGSGSSGVASVVLSVVVVVGGAPKGGSLEDPAPVRCEWVRRGARGAEVKPRISCRVACVVVVLSDGCVVDLDAKK